MICFVKQIASVFDQRLLDKSLLFSSWIQNLFKVPWVLFERPDVGVGEGGCSKTVLWPVKCRLNPDL